MVMLFYEERKYEEIRKRTSINVERWRNIGHSLERFNDWMSLVRINSIVLLLLKLSLVMGAKVDIESETLLILFVFNFSIQSWRLAIHFSMLLFNLNFSFLFTCTQFDINTTVSIAESILWQRKSTRKYCGFIRLFTLFNSFPNMLIVVV